MPTTTTSEKRSDPTPERASGFKRGYVACVACKARKVRCVINQEPPCAKCAREHRECRFNTKHATRKHRDVPKWAQQQQQQQQQQLHGQSPEHIAVAATPTSIASAGGGAMTANQDQSYYRDHRSSSPDGPPAFRPHPVEAAAPINVSLGPAFTERVVTGSSDALDILFEGAASAPSSLTAVGPLGSAATEPSVQGGGSPCLQPSSASTTTQYGVMIQRLSHVSDSVLDLWDRCRFVRQGWFTAQEAVTYVDLFYQHFGGLSNAVRDDLKDHANHSKLVCEEPFLCCTILMISSRWFILPGPGGLARSHFIHQRLWQYCELLLRRIMLGQEKHSTAKTRTLGSIEALIMISDWHPRALHFPPETEGWDGELISPAYDRNNRIHHEGKTPLIRWREDVFEPTRRAERMAWMLLGAAVCLAHEIGLFPRSTARYSASPGNDLRVTQTRSLLYIHVTQLANRLGRPSLLPENLSFTGVALSTTDTPKTSEELHLQLLLELTRITKLASTVLFQSTDSIRSLTIDGNYVTMLEHLEPSFARWLDDFHKSSTVLSDSVRLFLRIELYHLRALTRGLSLQAIVERALAQGIRDFHDCRGGLLESCTSEKDRFFVMEVISSSMEVLQAAKALSNMGTLRYCPSRVLTYTTSASVFLLKALFLAKAIGPVMDSLDSEASLSVIDQCIAALKSSPIDDMDFSSRYATLIESHVARLRACMTVLGDSRPVTHSGGSTNSGQYCNQAVQGSLYNQAGNHQMHGPPHGSGNGGELAANNSNNNIMHADESWWAAPFDPTIAPFDSENQHLSLSLELDSLDFLWGMPDSIGTAS